MLKKINSLTPDQELKMAEFRDKWLGIGFSCQPADRVTAVIGVNEAYQSAGMEPPKYIIWLDSPLSGVYGAAILANSQVGAQVGDQVRAQVGAQVWDQVYKAGYGQHDANWLAFYDFFNFLGIVETSKLSGMNKIAQSSGWFWPFKNLCILSERPIHLFRDSSNQLHSENKAALEYKDGFKLFRWHGVTVPQWLIENPELVTVEKIESEQNSEVRRCMMERYGYERYIRDCNAVVVDSCDINHPIVGLRDAKLLVKKVVDDEDIVFVDMLNSTPEPDGSVNRYLIRVDPTAYDGDAALYCHAAAASTWRDELNGEFTFKNWKDYTPEFES